MTDDILELIGNPLLLAPERPFGAILGVAPSRGARSPILWRAAFAALGMMADFHPMDVSEARLAMIIGLLRADHRFVGGAVAVPYKQAILPLLDQVEPEALAIGAVNALYRLADGGLAGANTDGAAALSCLEEQAGAVAGRPVLLLGLGGAGKAVATYLAMAGAELTVWNRTLSTTLDFVAHMGGRGHPVTAAVTMEAVAFQQMAIVVNCTSCGFTADSRENGDSPIPLPFLGRLPRSAFVFDIIYQPTETALLRTARMLGHPILNGRCMNLRQAVLAFTRAVPRADPARIAQAMAMA